MSENTKPNDKPVIEIQIPLEVVENKEVTRTITTNPDLGKTEDVPTISTLLQRKKMPAAKPAAKGSESFKISEGPSLPPRPSDTNSGILLETLPIEIPQSDTPIQVGPPAIPIGTGQSEPSAAPVITRAKRKSPTGAGYHAKEAGAKVTGSIPLFKKQIKLESLDLETLQKRLSSHRGKTNLIKLDLLGYFTSFFPEVGLFLVSTNSAEGILGYGNPVLVSKARKLRVLFETIPSFFEIAMSSTPFVGDPNALNPAEIDVFHSLGFHFKGSIGFFPIVNKPFLRKKRLVGFFVCFGNEPQDFNTQTLKKLQTLLAKLGSLD